MKKIPGKVVFACVLCAACIVIGGVLQVAAPELRFVAQVIAWSGIGGVAVETFSWGAREGYVIRRQGTAVQIEHVLRCAVMSAIMVFVSVLVAGPVLQAALKMFLRK